MRWLLNLVRIVIHCKYLMTSSDRILRQRIDDSSSNDLDSSVQADYIVSFTFYADLPNMT